MFKVFIFTFVHFQWSAVGMNIYWSTDSYLWFSRKGYWGCKWNVFSRFLYTFKGTGSVWLFSGSSLDTRGLQDPKPCWMRRPLSHPEDPPRPRPSSAEVAPYLTCQWSLHHPDPPDIAKRKTCRTSSYCKHQIQPLTSVEDKYTTTDQALSDEKRNDDLGVNKCQYTATISR